MEIARRLKVSQTTVSMVLNNPSTSKVSPEKRRKIMDMMRNSKYFLKSQSGKTWIIGYVLNPGMDISSTFYGRFLAGLQKVSAEAGYHVIVDNENICESAMIVRRKVDGIILQNALPPGALKKLAMEIPLVLLNCPMPETVCDMVVPDKQGGIVKSLDHLLANGHSRIAFFGAILSGGKVDGNPRCRKEMFENESKARGLPMRHDYVKIASIKHASVEETGKMISEALSFWVNLPQRPTAVICHNDQYAKLLLRASAEMGIKIPDDLSVIGTDNTDECEYTYPALTSIDHNAVEMGRLAAELLLKRISHSGRPCTRTNCDSRLVIRKSTGPAKSK